MIYKNMKKGVFLSRPNRFIANIELDGIPAVCHVKNTGRCRELLTERAEVFVQKSDNPNRKTQYDLISVYKGTRFVNMDSQAPNKVAAEFISDYFSGVKLIKPEKNYGNSRFDFYVETEAEKAFIEVKGVTLEKDNVVLFPDAPTERGVKHLNELCKCISDGYSAFVIFVIQMENADYFTPNYETHREFGEALKKAEKQGVNIIAFDCKVTENSLEYNKLIPVKL